MKKLAIHIVIAACLAGCSSIVSGTSQTLTINTNPPGADCKLTRNDIVIGRVNPTPGGIVVQKTKHNITVACVKDGYQEATYVNKSGIEGATFGNIVLGGGIGWAIDSASGADNKYDEVMNLTLVPTEVQPQAPKGPLQEPEAAPASSSVQDRLNALKDLRDRGVITPEEYAAKRKEILKAL